MLTGVSILLESVDLADLMGGALLRRRIVNR